MKRIARYFYMLPELQREIFAVERWWVVLFSMLGFGGVVALAGREIQNGVAADNTVTRLYAFLSIITGYVAVINGTTTGLRTINHIAKDPRISARLNHFSMLGLLLASMLHTYLLLFAALPCFGVIVICAWNAALTWKVVVIFICLESSGLFYAGIGLCCATLANRQPLTISLGGMTGVFTLTAIFIAAISFIPTYKGFLPLFSVGNSFSLYDLEWDFTLSHYPALSIPLWAVSVFMQMLALLCFLKINECMLSTTHGWRMDRLPFFGLAFVLSFGAFIDLFQKESTIKDSLAIISLLLLLAPLLIVPGHEQLRNRSLSLEHKSRWRRFWSPRGAAFLPLAAGAAVTTLPFIAASCLQTGIQANHIPQKESLAYVMTIILFFTWSCLFASLIEHCELYVRRKGRLLATLVGGFILFTPTILASTSSIYLQQWFSPFCWLDPNRRDLIPLLAQAGVVSLLATGIHLWTDLQRRRMARAQRERIRRALGNT